MLSAALCMQMVMSTPLDKRSEEQNRQKNARCLAERHPVFFHDYMDSGSAVRSRNPDLYQLGGKIIHEKPVIIFV